MRILILGGNGMLGHQLFKHVKDRHETRVTLRQEIAAYEEYSLFSSLNAYDAIDVRATGQLEAVFDDFQPEVIVNAVGITKQLPSAHESIPSIEMNALFPHQLALLCQKKHGRLIHLSTDCVFSGQKGNYREADPADAQDLYGRTKFLGEINEKHCLTLRKSMIGQELSHRKGLLEWFLAQEGSVSGFRGAIFSGFTTKELSRIIEMIVTKYPAASGIYHVSSDPISKYDLLMMIKKSLELPVKIIADDSFACDRSLDSSKFRREFRYNPPSWEEMVDELCRDIEYAKLKR